MQACGGITAPMLPWKQEVRVVRVNRPGCPYFTEQEINLISLSYCLISQVIIIDRSSNISARLLIIGAFVYLILFSFLPKF